MSRSKVKVTVDKNEELWHFFGSGPRGRSPPQVLRKWENQRMLSSFFLNTEFFRLKKKYEKV